MRLGESALSSNVIPGWLLSNLFSILKSFRTEWLKIFSLARTSLWLSGSSHCVQS